MRAAFMDNMLNSSREVMNKRQKVGVSGEMDKCLNNFGIKLAAAVSLQFMYGSDIRQASSISAIRRHTVKGIDDGADSSQIWNLGAG